MKIKAVGSLSALLLSIFLANATQTDSIAVKDTSMKTVTVDKFVFNYKIDGLNLKGSVSYPTTGWVAIGFNPKMIMENAHMIMGTVVNGKAVVSEEFGTGWFSHKPVASVFGKSDIISSDCSVDNGITTLSFSIPLKSSIGKIAEISLGKETKVIFADGESSDLQKKHKHKTKTKIKF
jgi:hypothetical protein